jgi:hypothetical protein
MLFQMCGECGPDGPVRVAAPKTYIWQYCPLDRGMIRIAACPILTAELFSELAHYCWPSKRWHDIVQEIIDTLGRTTSELEMLNSKRMSEMLNDNVHKKLFPTWL